MYWDLYVISDLFPPVLQDRGYLTDMFRLASVLKKYFSEHGWIEGEDYTIQISMSD